MVGSKLALSGKITGIVGLSLMGAILLLKIVIILIAYYAY